MDDSEWILTVKGSCPYHAEKFSCTCDRHQETTTVGGDNNRILQMFFGENTLLTDALLRRVLVEAGAQKTNVQDRKCTIVALGHATDQYEMPMWLHYEKRQGGKINASDCDFTKTSYLDPS